jgi:hypothetical protein
MQRFDFTTSNICCLAQVKANADAARAASEEQRLLTEQLAAVEVQWLNAIRLASAYAPILLNELF